MINKMDKETATSTESSQLVKKTNAKKSCKKPEPQPEPDTYYAYLFPNNKLVCNRNRHYLRNIFNINDHVTIAEVFQWYNTLVDQIGENLNEIQTYVENDPLNPGFAGSRYNKILKRYLRHHEVRCVASSNTIDNLRTQLVALGLTFTTLNSDGRGVEQRYNVVDITALARPLTYVNVVSPNDIYFPIMHYVPDLRIRVLSFDP